MRLRSSLLALLAVLWVSTAAYAQGANVTGTVVDQTGSILPGATITFTDRSSGRQLTDVTNDRGVYRLVGVPPGTYSARAQLEGFAESLVESLELLVGQSATITFTLALATLSEGVTVSAVAPIVDTRQAQVASNIDRRQMEDLPINGRNWLELSLLVKGVTSNVAGDTPGANSLAGFQLNLDGQEITQGSSITGFGQPGVSRDAIAEYQIVTTMFDVSMGRSIGMQVQAITKSGSNRPAGSLYGYFRNDALNAADHFTHKVLPYENTQVGGSLGGPFVENTLHYFGSYEYETEPGTAVMAQSALPGQVLSLPTKTTKQSAMFRVDSQFSAKDHLVVRTNYYVRRIPNFLTTSPYTGSKRDTTSYFFTANWSRPITNNLLHELKVGYYTYYWVFEPMAGQDLVAQYLFPGLALGPSWNYPEEINQSRWPFRYDLTYHRGAHDVKLGAEFIKGKDFGWWPARARGMFYFSALPPDANRRFRLADWDNFAAWDFSGLDPLVVRYDQAYASDWNYDVPRPTMAAWIGDTWAVNDRLTLNLGVRYDLLYGDTAPPGVRETDIIIDNGKFTENVGYRNDIRDWNNISPRIGFTWKATDAGDLVLRGGGGLFYSQISADPAFSQQMWNGQKVIMNSYRNDGLPGFLADPTRGVTAEDVLSGQAPLAPQAVSVIQDGYQMPSTFQAMVGFQKQLGEVMGFDADLVYARGWSLESQRDPNVFYDPATGYYLPPARVGRPNPAYGPIALKESHGRSESLMIPMSFTRRFRNNWQLGATYTLMLHSKDTGIGQAGYFAQQVNPFDIDLEWGRAATFQRHTFRANGIWRTPLKGLSIAGSFQYGSGNPLSIGSGVDPLGSGLPGAALRLRRDYTLIPRNTFPGDPYQTLDLRLTQEFTLVGTLRASLMAEVFNVYNYGRYNYSLVETSPSFGQRISAGNIPRTGQLAFRIAF